MTIDPFMSKSDDHMKCRWCNFRVSKFFKTKSGETKSGWSSLQSHCWSEHINEMEEIRYKIYTSTKFTTIDQLPLAVEFLDDDR